MTVVDLLLDAVEHRRRGELAPAHVAELAKLIALPGVAAARQDVMR